jgi:hypothetical protein
MSNNTISGSNVKRRNTCFDDNDWTAFNVTYGPKGFNLNGVSSLFRMFFRGYEKFGNMNLVELSTQLQAEGYQPTLIGLYKKLIKENDRIEPSPKAKQKKETYDKIIKESFLK